MCRQAARGKSADQVVSGAAQAQAVATGSPEEVADRQIQVWQRKKAGGGGSRQAGR